MLVEQSLYKAIKFYGNKQVKLAAAIGEKPDKIRYWLNSNGKIPFHNAIAIELATSGAVSRFDLAPYARCTEHSQQAQVKQLTISNHIAIGIAFEHSLLRHSYKSVKGRRDVRAANFAGFGNHVSYRQAKKVVTHGVYKLIQAMDDKLISISNAAIIADLPPTIQESILLNNKKKIIQIIKEIKLEKCK